MASNSYPVPANPAHLPKPTPAQRMRRIRRVSRAMVYACRALVLVLPVALVWYWATVDLAALAPKVGASTTNLATPWQAWQRWMGGLAHAMPMAMMCLGLWQAQRCFTEFAEGQLFTGNATTYLRSFAGWTAGAALAAIVASALTSVILTMQNPPGSRQLAISISSNDVLTLFFAALLWLMSDIIAQGQLLAEESDGFV